MAIRFSRRSVVVGAGAVGVLQPWRIAAAALPLAELDVTDLRVDYQWMPLAIEGRAPSLSWRLMSTTEGETQHAYRVVVATSAEALQAGTPDLWDSGRVETGESVGIRYAGRPLASREACHWQVEVWTGSGTKARSAIARWEMGLLEPSDWTASWLGAESPQAREDRLAGLKWISAGAGHKEVLFRRRIDVPVGTRAELIVIARGALSLALDGSSVPLPPVHPFVLGAAPAVRVPLRLGGAQTLQASVVTQPSPELRPPYPAPALAALLRIETPGQPTMRITTRDWEISRDGGRSWTAALALDDPHEPWPPEPAIQMRRPFDAPRQARRARLYVTALGGYVAHLNGHRIGDAQLAPESTDFRRRVLYQCHDVTSLLRVGGNCLGLMVADGWYASDVMLGGRYAYGPAPRRALAQLEIEFDDGTTMRVGTDEAWHAAESAVTRAEIYDGEDYDARREQPGWSTPGFQAQDWFPALPAPAPPCALVSQCDAPIRKQLRLPALAITSPRPGLQVVDFGQNFAGWARLQVKGPAGTLVVLRYAELLTPEGRADQSNLRAARASDHYTLKGDAAGESYEPQFTYHGFRYVEVEGYPGTLTERDIEGVVIFSDLAQTGRLSTSLPLIDALWRNTLWSQRSNFVGIPTDCPQRDERLGWMGDAHVFWDTAAFNMDVAAFTRRFLGDVRDAQADDGAFADYAPAARKLVLFGVGAAPGWADGGVVLPWTSWRRYGDTAVIDQHWDAMTRYATFIRDRNPDAIWRHGRGNDYGDWLALDAKQPGDPTTPKELIGTAMWANSLQCLVQMAGATGRRDEATRYSAECDRVASAFRAQFVRADGSIGNGSQTGYILALRYGLVPPSLRSAAAARLVADIRGRGTLLSTGFLGTPHSLDVLSDAGESALVYDLLLRTKYPSWGYMIAKGATSIWERWNGDTGDVWMNSFNHYALGAICGFMVRRIAGIDPLEPAFARFRFDPVLDARLARASASYDSVRGRITTEWQRDGARFQLSLTVPANTVAEVRLPAASSARVREGGRKLEARRSLRQLDRTDTTLTLEAGSGAYAFDVT